ncbi:efflux RND transporter permease subunit [Magnetospirillum sulfuroxidans]|uniref:Efflux RND transporter permease subunit n=1 Tax=Magnetospirillum sulfuroxidans TaxID=611300 RepID=A0ABS5I836_9PROT|nr:efflux RND transporter permease subunit [Magnetospirillum sulfuroxidans]MBR9970603.1 efflux RND transporter permease subunit [Magnetospirillum sulfuroxidans]
MRLPELCIRRPVLATVMSLMIVLVGLVAYDRLPVREYPNIDEPVVTVETTYKGASAEIVETQVSKILEDSLAGIEGIDVLSSLSRSESSQITIRFKVTRDADSAASDVRDRVARVRGKLPDDVDEPVIAKVEADAQPIIYLAFSSDRHDALFVSDYAWRFVRTRLQNLTGVADIRIFGERKYAMRIWLDRVRLAAYAMTPQDVENALKRQNLEVPAGRIESAEREFTVLSETDLKTPEQFADIILAESKGYSVRLGDVAKVEIGPRDERRVTRFNGSSAVALGVVKQSVANPLDVSAAVRGVLPEIRDSLPEGMKVDVGYDSSVFIERSIEAVFRTIAEAVILVVLVIFFFLRTVRATLIPLVTIPVSLIGAFALMYVLGFSINTLTLLSMVLAIGLVVDDAIVVLENIFRHIEEGMEPVQAAITGAREIAFAVIAMTITLAAVYVPLAFMTGRTGKLFVEFALTLAAAVMVSGFAALTLSPMMCSRLLRHEAKHSRLYVLIENFLEAMTQGYRRMLERSLGGRPAIVGLGAVVAVSAIALFLSLKSELTPTEDRGTIVVIGIGPEGATVGNIDKYSRMVERFIADVPVVERYFVLTGVPVVNQMLAFVRVKDWSERSVSQMSVARGLMPKLMSVPGMLAFAVNPPSLGERASSKPLQVVIQSAGTYEDLQKANDAFMAEASKIPGLISLDSDLKLNKPQIKVSMDRDRIADIGSSVDVVGRTLETMLGGRQVTRFKREGEQYDVIVQVADVDRRNPNDMTSIYVRGDKGDMVQMSNLLTLQEGVAARELNHFNQLRAATISANLAPGYTMGQAVAELEAIGAKVLPGNSQLDYNGPSREFKSSSSAMWMTFALALLFIYLVLAAQFESFVDPFIIMLTVPLSMAGALAALKLSGGTLNVYSQIGLVTLIGLITKHGILIVEFSNQLRDQGKAMGEAVMEAAALRLRPILMTTGAMVLGAIPLALAHGAGAESRQQIGWVIVGGISVGTFFTLFVVPVAYTLLAKRNRHGGIVASQGQKQE